MKTAVVNSSPQTCREIIKTGFSVQGQLLRSNYWATDQDIFSILTTMLRDPVTGRLSANIIHPGYSGVSPFATDIYVNHVRSYLGGNQEGYEQLADLTLPTVMIVNDSGYNKDDFEKAKFDQKAKERLKQSKGSHWTLCIHLPAGYLAHAQARLIYIDSYNLVSIFPPEIATHFIQGANPVFPAANSIHISTNQQIEGYGCGFFATYYAIYLVLTGNTAYLQGLPKDSNRNFESNLRALFQPFYNVDAIHLLNKKLLTKQERHFLLIEACLSQKEAEYEQILEVLLSENSEIDEILRIAVSDNIEMQKAKTNLVQLIKEGGNIYHFYNNQQVDNVIILVKTQSSNQARIQNMLKILDEILKSENKDKELLTILLKKLAWIIQELPEQFKAHGTFRKIISEYDWSYLEILPVVLREVSNVDIEIVLKDLNDFKDYLEDLKIIQQSKNPAEAIKNTPISTLPSEDEKLHEAESKDNQLVQSIKNSPRITKPLLRGPYLGKIITKIPEIQKLVIHRIDNNWIEKIQSQIDIVTHNYQQIVKNPISILAPYHKIAIFRAIEIIGEFKKRLSDSKLNALGISDLNLDDLRDKLAHLSKEARKFIQGYDVTFIIEELQQIKLILSNIEKDSVQPKAMKAGGFQHLVKLTRDFPNAASDKFPLAEAAENNYKELLNKVFSDEVKNKILKLLKDETSKFKSRGKDIHLTTFINICILIANEIVNSEHLMDAFYQKMLVTYKNDDSAQLNSVIKFLTQLGYSKSIVSGIISELSKVCDKKKFKMRGLKAVFKTTTLPEKSTLLKLIPSPLQDSENMVLTIVTPIAKTKFDQFLHEIEDLLEPIQAAIDMMKGNINYETIFGIIEPICYVLQKILQEIGDLAGILTQNAIINAALTIANVTVVKPKRLIALLLLRNTLSHSFHELTSVEIRALVISLLLEGRNEVQNVSAMLDQDVLSLDQILLHGSSHSEAYESVINKEFIEHHAPLLFAYAQKYGFNKHIYILNYKDDKIGPSPGLHLYVEFNEDIDAGLVDRLWERDLRLFLLRRDLSEILNCTVIVDTEETLKNKRPNDTYTEEDISKLLPDLDGGQQKGDYYIRLDAMRREIMFTNDFMKSQVKEFILPGGIRVDRTSLLFNQERIREAIHVTYSLSQDEHISRRIQEQAHRQALLTNPKLQHSLTQKASKLTQLILKNFPKSNRAKWLCLFKIEAQINKRLDQYFDTHFAKINKAWVNCPDIDTYNLAKRNFRKAVKYRERNFKLILDKNFQAGIEKLLSEWDQAFKQIYFVDRYQVYGKRQINISNVQDFLISLYLPRRDNMKIFNEMLNLFSSAKEGHTDPNDPDSLLPSLMLASAYQAYLQYKKIAFIIDYLGIEISEKSLGDSNNLKEIIYRGLEDSFCEPDEIGMTVNYNNEIFSIIPLFDEFWLNAPQQNNAITSQNFERKKLQIIDKVRALHNYTTRCRQEGRPITKMSTTDNRISFDMMAGIVAQNSEFISVQIIRGDAKVTILPQSYGGGLYDYLTAYGLSVCQQYYPGDLVMDNREFVAIFKMDAENLRLEAAKKRIHYLVKEKDKLLQLNNIEKNTTARALMDYQLFILDAQLKVLKSFELNTCRHIRNIEREANQLAIPHVTSQISFKWFSGACRANAQKDIHPFLPRPGI